VVNEIDLHLVGGLQRLVALRAAARSTFSVSLMSWNVSMVAAVG